MNWGNAATTAGYVAVPAYAATKWPPGFLAAGIALLALWIVVPITAWWVLRD